MQNLQNSTSQALEVTETVLVLRTCKADLTSPAPEARGFRWPESGPVSCPDWDPGPRECGGGLHGFLHGEGSGSLACWDADAKWLVIEVDKAKIVKVDNTKVRFPDGVVLYAGSREVATAMISARYPDACVIGGTSTSGDGGTSTSGDGGTIAIRWWDGAREKYRVAIGEIGEGGLLANVGYKVDERGMFVPVETGGKAGA